MDQQEAQNNREEELAEIVDYCHHEIIEELESGLRFTDVVLAGYDFTEQFDGAASIMFAGILKLRNSIENAIFWIENQDFGDCDGDYNDDDEEDNSQL